MQLNTGYCGSGSNPFPDIISANSTLQPNVHDTLPVPVPLLIGNYHSIAPDAVTNNLLSFNSSTKQFHDVSGRSQIPYLAHNLFAATAVAGETYTGTAQFILKNDLIWNNSGKTISQVQIDFDDGDGFQTLTIGTSVTINYYTTGTKQWTIKITFTDSSVWQCYSPYQVLKAAENYSLLRFQPGTGGAFGGGFDDHETFNAVSGVHSGADVYIAYTGYNRTNTLRKPLIVIEGFDAGNILPSFGNYTYKNFIDDIDKPNADYDFNSQLDDVAHYDIVFIDFKNGTDDIRSNAALVEEVIAWVNTNKVPNSNNGNITEQNVVLGISMGGLVGRYALAEMTKNNVATDTRLLITHDSPHRGANVPLGLQYLLRMTGDVILFGYNVRDIYPEYGQTINLLNEPASQQMLLYRSTSKNTFASNTFLNGDYRTMITFSPGGPQPAYEFIATSNGSECGTALFAPYQQLLNAEAAAGFSIISVSSKFRSTIRAFALPNDGQTNEIARLYIESKFRILFFNVSKTVYDEVAYAPQSHLPIDGAPGGVNPYIGNSPVKAWFNLGGVAAAIAQGNPTNFTFVPTASALDIQSYNVGSLSGYYVYGWSPANPSGASTFIAQEAPSGGIGEYNVSHTLFTARNAHWLYNEMENVSNNNLNCSSTCAPVSPVISGADSFYYINDLPSGVTINWSTTGDISIFCGSTTGSSVNVRSTSGASSGTLYATCVTACGNVVASRYITDAYPVISGPEQFCNNSSYYPASYTTENADPGSITWTVDGDIAISGTTTGSQVLIVPTGPDGYGNLYASACGNVIAQKSIMVGTPAWSEVIMGLDDVYVGNGYPVQIGAPYPGATSYSWSTSFGAWVAYEDDVTAEIGADSPGYHTIYVTAHTECGDQVLTWEFYAQENYFYSYNVYPNPAGDELTVSYDVTDSKKSKTISYDSPLKENPFEIKLYDNKGNVLRGARNEAGQKSVIINTRDIPNGTYYLHILEGKKVTKKQIIIRH